MSGNKVILDSNVIIDAVANTINISESLKAFNHLSVSFITYIEVVGYQFKSDNERLRTLRIMESLEIIFPDMEIADLTIQYRKLKKIKIPDAIILATARKTGAHLMTSNTADFINIDEFVNLIKPVMINEKY